MAPRASWSTACRWSSPWRGPFGLSNQRTRGSAAVSSAISSRHVGGAVADDQHLELLNRLRKGALDGEAQRRPVVVRRNEDAGGEHHAGSPASNRSSATARTIAAPSAALLLGGGPPRRCSTKAR